jgi:hypothetical protein
VKAYLGPASGPKWLVLTGIDRALLASDFFRKATRDGGRLLLAGSSAGAWRSLALASRDPQKTHKALEDGYVSQVFPRSVPAWLVTAAYRTVLAEVFPREDLQYALEHAFLDVALHLARARGPAGSRRRRVQGLALFLAGSLNALSAKAMDLFFHRVLLHTHPQHFARPFKGILGRLELDGALDAALASGTIPLYMEPPDAPEGAPEGRYVDGGLMDYHLNQAYLEPGQGILLFPHFQERIVPNWFDRYLPWRRPGREDLADVLQIFPSATFVAGLPGGRIPLREDFLTFVDDPDKRVQRWRTASRESNRLGEQLLSDMEHHRLPELIEPLHE